MGGREVVKERQDVIKCLLGREEGITTGTWQQCTGQRVQVLQLVSVIVLARIFISFR
jgi:hypothetical protein